MAMDMYTSILAMKLQREEQKRQEEREDRARADITLQKSMQDMMRKQSEIHTQQMARDSMDLKIAQEKHKQALDMQKAEMEKGTKIAKALLDFQKAKDLEAGRNERASAANLARLGAASIRSQGRVAGAKELTAAQFQTLLDRRKRGVRSERNLLMGNVTNRIRAIDAEIKSLKIKELDKPLMKSAKDRVAVLQREKQELNKFKSSLGVVNPLGNIDKAEGDLAALQGHFAAIWGSQSKTGDISQSLTPGEEVEPDTTVEQRTLQNQWRGMTGDMDMPDEPTEDELVSFEEQYKAGI